MHSVSLPHSDTEYLHLPPFIIIAVSKMPYLVREKSDEKMLISTPDSLSAIVAYPLVDEYAEEEEERRKKKQKRSTDPSMDPSSKEYVSLRKKTATPSRILQNSNDQGIVANRVSSEVIYYRNKACNEEILTGKCVNLKHVRFKYEYKFPPFIHR